MFSSKSKYVFGLKRRSSIQPHAPFILSTNSLRGEGGFR